MSKTKASINDLPFELLSHVLVLSLPASQSLDTSTTCTYTPVLSPTRGTTADTSHYRRPVELGKVSHRWYNVTRQTPQLWTRIHLSLRGSKDDQARADVVYLERCLRLSCTRKLDIVIDYASLSIAPPILTSDSHEPPPAKRLKFSLPAESEVYYIPFFILNIVDLQRRRIERLHIGLPSYTMNALMQMFCRPSFGQQPFPNLTDLCITNEILPPKLGRVCLSKFPVLKNLSIRNMAIDVHHLYATVAKIYGSPATIMEHIVKLDRLAFTDSLPASWIAATLFNIPFLHITSLHLEFTSASKQCGEEPTPPARGPRSKPKNISDAMPPDAHR